MSLKAKAKITELKNYIIIIFIVFLLFELAHWANLNLGFSFKILSLFMIGILIKWRLILEYPNGDLSVTLSSKLIPGIILLFLSLTGHKGPMGISLLSVVVEFLRTFGIEVHGYHPMWPSDPFNALDVLIFGPFQFGIAQIALSIISGMLITEGLFNQNKHTINRLEFKNKYIKHLIIYGLLVVGGIILLGAMMSEALQLIDSNNENSPHMHHSMMMLYGFLFGALARWYNFIEVIRGNVKLSSKLLLGTLIMFLSLAPIFSFNRILKNVNIEVKNYYTLDYEPVYGFLSSFEHGVVFLPLSIISGILIFEGLVKDK